MFSRNPDSGTRSSGRTRSIPITGCMKEFNTGRNRSETEIAAGTVVILEADFSPNAVALFLALVEARSILVPLTRSVEMKKREFIEIVQGEVPGFPSMTSMSRLSPFWTIVVNHPLYQKIHELNHPGLILFSSGSTGKSKAALHDLDRSA